VTVALIPPGRPAPDWRIAEWIGPGAPSGIAALRGKVIVVHAFQLLCPACVHHGIPQAQRIQAGFPQAQVSVIGLHTVFEHHDAMTPTVLRAFMHENRIAFPVGVDAPSSVPGDPIPETMRVYGLRGTPTLLLIDRNGDLRHHAFGVEEDLAVGAAIATLVSER